MKSYNFSYIHDIITSPVTEIKDFERVPENIVSWMLQPVTGCLGYAE